MWLIKGWVSVEELAEEMAYRGLLRRLNVRSVLDADGIDARMFEIPANGRRFGALWLRMKKKRPAKCPSIPCLGREALSEFLASDDALTADMQQLALHLLDQFHPFQALCERGQAEKAIAAAFFVTPQTIRRRLKLAYMAPALLEIYAENAMTLKQLMDFTVNPGHRRQIQVWTAMKNSSNKQP